MIMWALIMVSHAHYKIELPIERIVYNGINVAIYTSREFGEYAEISRTIVHNGLCCPNLSVINSLSKLVTFTQRQYNQSWLINYLVSRYLYWSWVPIFSDSPAVDDAIFLGLYSIQCRYARTAMALALYVYYRLDTVFSFYGDNSTDKTTLNLGLNTKEPVTLTNRGSLYSHADRLNTLREDIHLDMDMFKVNYMYIYACVLRIHIVNGLYILHHMVL